MTVIEIVKEYLVAHGYDGLCSGSIPAWSEGCCCKLDDLAPGDNNISNCVPGYLHPSDCECEVCAHSDPLDREQGLVCKDPPPKEEQKPEEK